VTLATTMVFKYHGIQEKVRKEKDIERDSSKDWEPWSSSLLSNSGNVIDSLQIF